MKDAHQNMRLTNTEFDVTVEHLINTLKDMNVNAAVIAEISKLVETLRKDIVFAGPLTIYEQIGGDKAMEAAVDIFYKRMLEDPKVSSFFKSTDMVKQREQQKLFISMALGGPKE
jgi:truncated hemoglobin YjbI